MGGEGGGRESRGRAYYQEDFCVRYFVSLFLDGRSGRGMCISVVNIFQNSRDSDVCLLLQFEFVKPGILLLHLKGKPFKN